MPRLPIWVFLLLAAALPAPSRVMVVYRLASPPIPVEAGQQFALCAANVGRVPADLQLQLINVRTGAIVAEREITLPPPGSATAMPDPCITTTAAVIASANAQPALLVGLVVSRRGLFARATAATASIQITQATASGEVKLLGSVPLLLATMTNGRNTPIETVK